MPVPFHVALEDIPDEPTDVDSRFAVRDYLLKPAAPRRRQYRMATIGRIPGILTPKWVGITVAAMSLCMIVGAGWLVHAGHKTVASTASANFEGSPELSSIDRQTLWTMLNQADDLAVTGQWEEADRLYSRLEQYLVNHPPNDPVLLEQLKHETLRHQAVLESLAVRNARNTYTPPVAETPKPPPATAPVQVASVTPAPASEPSARFEPVAPIPLHVTPQLIPAPELSDEQIGKSIKKGADFLVKLFDANTHELTGPHDAFGTHNGLDALCVYALMQAGLALPSDDQLDIQKPFMHQLITKLSAMPMEERIETYGRGLRATALALADRKEFKPALQKDVGWLLRAHKAGGYGYGMGAANGEAWDNSNTQYGQLGVWSAAETGVEIPSIYWHLVEKHWDDNQIEDGSWGYMEHDTSPRLSMTAAGVASLFVAHDYLDPPDLAGQVGRPPFTKALEKGLQWFETGDNILAEGQERGYTLYGVERVGLASGFKFFGKHNWYPELAKEVVKSQGEDGSWYSDDPIETAYILLFLARGRHPVVMNKLRFDGFWANRPRDVANLTRFATHELERPLNWQVVPIERPWQDWADSPILYLASQKAVPITQEQVGQIRRYVEAGGLLFTHADGGTSGFNDFARDLARQLFPEYPLVDLKPDNELYSVLYTVPTKPRLQVVTNGARILMVHSPTDLSMFWQQRASATHPVPFDMGVNLFLYAGGKTNLQNRLTSLEIPKPPAITGGAMKIAQFRFGPENAHLWQPEPYMWQRFGDWFQWQTSCGISPIPLPLDQASGNDPSLGLLTGAVSYSFSEREIKAVRDYVDQGGTLLIECVGGSAAFADSANQLLAKAFPDASLKNVPPSYPLLLPTVTGMEDLSSPRVRPYVTHKLGSADVADSLQLLSHGHGRVIFSRLDMTEGLIGARAWAILGYEPSYAQSLLKNLVLWTAAGFPQQPTKSADAR